jgi:hypothetical protein
MSIRDRLRKWLGVDRAVDAALLEKHVLELRSDRIYIIRMDEKTPPETADRVRKVLEAHGILAIVAVSDRMTVLSFDA